ncbi:hypothetical protein ACFE04_008085 [Oxalis oulophora]
MSIILSLSSSSSSSSSSCRQTTTPPFIPLSSQHSAPLLRRYHAGNSFTFTTRTRRSHIFQASSGAVKEVIMVDPVEAKRLADNQMKQIQTREKQKRRRQIEAINGAWAMIGLTAGLVIEGETGKGILAQLASYWYAITHFFVG